MLPWGCRSAWGGLLGQIRHNLMRLLLFCLLNYGTVSAFTGSRGKVHLLADALEVFLSPG